MKNELWLVLLILFFILLVFVLTLSAMNTALVEDDEPIECWVICQPEDWVVIRAKPKRKAEETGYAYGGWRLLTDGKIKNGYLHIIDASTEYGEGWVHTGYIVYDEPQAVYEEMDISSSGRVSCRRSINGRRRCWAKDGETVLVYWVTEEWAVTNKGFVKRYLLDTVSVKLD